MRRCVMSVALLLCLFAATGPVLGGAESPKEMVLSWYLTLMDNHDTPSGRMMDAMIVFYCDDLQYQMMPDKEKGLTPDERSRADKAETAAVRLHKDWAAFLASAEFTEASFKNAEEHIEGEGATVVVRSESNSVRSFHLINEGRGWVISKLPSPTQYAAMVRILVIIIVAAIALALVARKMIFS